MVALLRAVLVLLERVRGISLAMCVVALVASGCRNHPDACNSRILPNVHLTLVDATTQAPVRGFAQVDQGLYDGYDDCYDCGGCSTVNVLVAGAQTVWVMADGYARVTLQLDGGSGSGVCGHTFRDISEVVQMTPQPGATAPPAGIVCMDMSVPADM
jgi:hypothetical protein